MSNERMVIGARLKEAREYLGISQQDVAEALKVPRSAISLLETGQRKVDAIELRALAQLYQRPIGHFTGEEAEAEVPAEVAMLARQASQLSQRDRDELLRFSEFLLQRSNVRGSDGNKA